MALILTALLLAAPVAVGGYAYLMYPLLLLLLSQRKRPSASADESWVATSITLPVYNEEATIAEALDCLLRLEYPTDLLQIVVVSDASTDRTDEIVRRYADRGVELVRLPHRSGKTAAENATSAHVRGEIVVNTDASTRPAAWSLKPLIAAFRDPSVGVASGRDVSSTHSGNSANEGESVYVGYEMWVRGLETEAGGIVGASGCYFATRANLHRQTVPPGLSRDFAAPLLAKERGYRSVSVADAVCYVPRTTSLRSEYRRKVRTMARGLQTLSYKRHLLNPFRYGRFAWMLFSHKLARWLVPWAMLLGAIGTVAASVTVEWMIWPVALAWALVIVAAALGWFAPGAQLPRVVTLMAFGFWSTVAGLHAWLLALRGDLMPTWEPTRRGTSGDAIGGSAEAT